MADAAPAFDATQPFEAVDNGGPSASAGPVVPLAPASTVAAEPPPAFDPSQFAEPVAPPSAAAPAFDPNKPFEPATDDSQWRGYLPVAAISAAQGAVTGTGGLIAGAPELFSSEISANNYNTKLLSTLDRIDRGEKVPMAEDPIGYQEMVKPDGSPDVVMRQHTRADVERAAGASQQAAQAYNPKETTLYKAGTAFKQFGKDTFHLSPEEEQSIWSRGWAGAGGMAPYLVAGALAGPEVGFALGMAGMGLSGAHEHAEAAREKGASPEDVTSAARSGFIANAAIGAIPMHVAMRPVERLAPGITDWAMARLKHAVQTSAAFVALGEPQEIVAKEIAKNFYDPEAKYSFDVQRLAATALTGFIVGSATPTPFRSGEKPAAEVPADQHSDALQNILGDQPLPPPPPGAPPSAEPFPVNDRSILGGERPATGPVDATAINMRASLGETPSAPLDFTPGLKAEGQDQADALKARWSAESPIKTVDDLFANAHENQAMLGNLGQSIADDLGVGFKNPGVKGRPRTQEKIDEGKSPARVNDVVRAGFVVEHPSQADAVVWRISQQYPVIDEGWAVTPVGYFDRKIIVRFPNGQAGEVQLWHPDLLDAKDKGDGHKLYVQSRTLADGDPQKAALEQKQREIYGQALAKADPEWKAVLGRFGRPGNLASKSALGNTRPSIPTTEELAFRQAPLTNTQASPGAQTKGSPSTVPNVNAMGTSTDNIGPQVPLGNPVPSIPPHRVTAANGMSVDVSPVVVEANSLRTSQDPGYDSSLQPRQRDRAASQAQVRDIATNLDPARLGYSAEADRGAPIVGPDGMVESGNGRVLALRSVYDQGGLAAQAYRTWLSSQGVDVSKYQNPVLVRQRTTPFDPDQRQAFTVAANQAATLSMSAPERALADARMLDANAISLIHNPDDLGSAGNRAFVRRFVAQLPQGEQGMMADAKGALSADGLARVRNAVLAKAYGDAGLLSRIAESTNDEVRSISSALTAAAPQWARMRAEIEAGRVRPDMDATPHLLDAVSRTADIRGRGDKLDTYLAQQDAFDRMPTAVEGFMRMFYDPKGQRAASAKRISDEVKFYAQEAAKVSSEEGLGLGLVPVRPEDILRLTLERQREGYGAEEGISDRNGAGNGAFSEANRGEVRGPWLGAGRERSPEEGDAGDQESAIRAQRLSIDEQRRLASEPIPLAGGKTGEQFVFPGTERITAAELAKRRAAEPLRPKAAQQSIDEGLFGGQQFDLVDQARQAAGEPAIDNGSKEPQIAGTEAPNAVRSGTEGTGIRAGTPAVSQGEQAGRARRATPVGRPEQLSLFGGGPSERPVFDANDAVQQQSGSAEVAAPGPGTSVTKPPARGGRAGEARPNTPAVEGLNEATAKIAQRTRSNYRITDADQIGVGGPKQKINDNINAIRALKLIEDEGRDATPGEKAILVKYVGWGAFAQDMFSPHKSEWKTERDTMRALVSDEEYTAAKGSTLNAHYTSPDVVRGMWDAMNHLGFKGGMAIEPAAGVGHFLGMIPDKVAKKTAWTAVELDPLTGRMAKALYGNAEVNVHGFEDLKRPSNYYDLAISNVPFGKYNISEKPYGSFPIHDFFFVKSLDKVRPGGVVAFITSRYSMDRFDPGTRRLLAKSADLVGAIRLPGGNKGAFAGNAGTQVTTDIMFLRKKIPGESPFPGAPWMESKEIQTPDGPARINEYFADHPEMMLGEMRLQGTMYRDNEPVLIGDSTGLQDKILAAAQNMPKDAMTPRATPKPAPIHGNDIAAGIKDGAFFLKDGELFQRREGQGFAHPLNAQDHDRVVRLIGMRTLYDDLLNAQMHPEQAVNQPDILRANLRDAYDSFVAKYGPINKEERTVTNRLNKLGEPVVITRHPNIADFRADPDVWKVASIEDYNSETDKAKRADIQTKDIINAPRERQINGPSDALAASLNDTGGVDLDHIAQSLNLRTQEDVVRSLGDTVYQNPNGRKWETADSYLSGDVVKKLEDARAISAEDTSYMRNVSALEKVQPEPLTAGDITAQFGAPWVPADVYKSFLEEIGGSGIEVSQVPITGEWKTKSTMFSRDARSKYGTDRVEVKKVVDAALNNKQITVWDEDHDGNKTVNDKATTEARVKTELLKEAFTGDQDHGIDGWAFADPDRAQQLEGIYNRTFNNLVARKFDGSHLTLPGLNPDFATRQHRKDAVWRIIQNGNTLLAHAVGSGKTATMIAAGMEQKRLGLISKPAFVVPNHMLEQFSREFIQAYPDAKILVAQKDEMTRENRKAFLAKTASNDWDGVVMTHDAFGRINMGQEFRKSFITDQLDQLERVIRAEVAESGSKKSPTVKNLENMKKKLQERLLKLMNEERKDDGTSFEESGIDHLFVDEAHKFKNLAFITRMQRVKGLAQGNSQRAEDLFLKMRYLEQKNPERSGVFATGTPVSNTMAELWTMMRYLELDKLKERGLDNFDNWANTFGRTMTNSELSADGRTFKDVTSFSKFTNVPELISLYSEIADTKTASMLNLPSPKVKTRSGAPGIEIVEATPSSQEEAHIESLVKLAEEIKGKRPEKGQPNMLSIVTAGRKVATDGRLIGADFDFNPQGKIAKAVDNISRIYKEGNADPEAPNKVQMVFLDMGVPQSKGAAKVRKAADIDEDVGADPAQATAPRIDLYADIKKRLVESGIPANEIAAIHDATDDAKKAKLFKKVRSGEIRVILGSSEKMGVGTNVQDRLIAMHHLDAPWKPADVEQRDGRIVRQGNKNSEVQIYRYVTKKSFDAFMWQKLDTKSKFIGQVLSGAKGSRHAEDIDNPLPEAAEMKAAASGDPRIIEHAELDRQVRALTAQRRSFEATKSRAQWESGTAKTRIGQYEEALPNAKADAAMVQDVSGQNFNVELGGNVFTERKEAGQAILNQLLAIDAQRFYAPKLINIGKLSGFEMNVEVRNGWDGSTQILRATPSLKGKAAYATPNDTVINAQTDPGGLIRRFENILGNIKSNPDRLSGELAREQENVAKLEKTLGETWPKEKDYRAALQKLDDLTKSLKTPADKGSPEALLAAANDLTKEWQQRVGDDIKVVLGGSLVSKTYVQHGKELPDLDVRFLTKDPERDWPRVAEATGLKFRKAIMLDDYPNGQSKGVLVEGPVTRNGITFDVEAAVRSPDYVGWARFYSEVMTPREIEAYRKEKADLKSSGDKDAYKALKLRVLDEVKKRVNDWGLLSGDAEVKAQRPHQTDTPEFKRWFGDSKITENGKPLAAKERADAFNEMVAAQTARRGGWDAAEGRDFGPKPGEKVVPIGSKTEAHIKPTDKYTAAEQKIADAVQEIGDRMAPQATVAGASALRQHGSPIWGAFVNSKAFPHLIAWSLEQRNAGKIAGTVRHEIIHHLREAGLIRPDEWAALRNAAVKEGWLNKYNIHDRYADATLDHKIEEAVAERFSEWRPEHSIEKPGLIRSAFQRMDLLFRRVAAAARQFLGKDATANDVFTRIETGEVGRRTSDQIEAQKAYQGREAAQTPGEEARKRREGVDPHTLGQKITHFADAIRAKSADFAKSIGLDHIVQEMQMKIAPMAARNATIESRAIAKEFMNARRQARQSWNEADKYIMNNFSHDERRTMWDAADEESVAIQRGRPTTGIGLDRLPPEQRAVVEMLQARGRRNFQEAKDLKMVEGEGLPSYAPRMLVRMSESGQRKRGAGAGSEVVRDIRTLAVANSNVENAIATRRLIDTIAEAGKRSGNPTVNDGGAPVRNAGALNTVSRVLDEFGRGTTATTPQLLHRKYLTREETEAAANRVPTQDENAPKWFTLSNPAFQRMAPRMVDADPKTYRDAYRRTSGVEIANVQVPARDEFGNIIFDKKPIYIREEFEGPLRSILSRDNNVFYRGLMALKGKVMSVVMFSPLIHNQVEWGRALPAAPGKVVTFQTYFEGNKVANDPAQMREAISGGLVPIGGHGYMQDIESIAEAPTLRPGRSLVAKGLGYGAEGVGQLTRLYDPRSGADQVRGAVDWFGNLWHNTLLWDRIKDLQMGLWSHIRQHLVDKGHDPYAANVAAAHFANRYAGALPLEAMSGMARGVANTLLFSRSFTLGNIGAYKDAVLGLPRDAQALIQTKLGWDELQKTQSYVKRKSRAMLAIDAGLYYAALSALQSSFHVAGVGHTVATLGGMIAGGALGGKGGKYGRLAATVGLGAAGFGLASVLGASQGTRDLEDELGRYWTRFKDLLGRIEENPLQTLGNPFKMIDSLGATAENEPGKQNRILLGYDKDGTAIYGRLAAGKVTEELMGYMTEPNEMIHRKLSTFARPVVEIYNNDYGFGRKVYNPKADTPAEVAKNIMKIGALLVGEQLPVSAVKGSYDWMRGGKGSDTAGLKAVAPMFGTTVSSGYPGGPELGVLADAKERQRYRQQEALPGIRDQIRQGDVAGALTKMQELNIPRGLQTYYVKTTQNPSARLNARQLRDFMQAASPEEKQEFERAQRNRPETSGSGGQNAAGGAVVARAAGGSVESYDTPLSTDEEADFQKWKLANAPNDSGADYDLRGAYKAGLQPAENEHWDDTFKKPNHPTFSTFSQYAKDRPDLAGTWDGDQYVPPATAHYARGGRVNPKNIDHNPSPAQIEAGNYSKDKLSWNGIPLTIENAKGSIRRGMGKDGPWQSVLPAHYGYARRSEGADGDGLDFYLGPHTKSPRVYVIDQVDADSKRFDEHKICAGFGSKKQAIEIYKRAFSDGKGHARIGHVREMTIGELKHWMDNGDTKKPIREHA